MNDHYESFFQLTERPFAAAPRIERYYPAEAAEAVRTAAARCIERAEGFAVILGAAGSGKTLLCQVLAEQFRHTLTPVFMLGGELASAKALLQKILFELGLPYTRKDEGELRLALMVRIAADNGTSEGLLLVVDEAQSLKPKLFEELRLLSNVVRKGKSRVRLVLAGGSALEERLAHPKLTAFGQRIAVRATLHPFSPAETQEYVRAQTAVVGGDPDAIWSDDSLFAVHEVTGGVPRLINQVCDHALMLAASGGAARIHAAGIEEAWADLQQLPLPGGSRNPRPAELGSGKSEAVIEFGSLDDDLPAISGSVWDHPALNAESESEVELVFDNQRDLMAAASAEQQADEQALSLAVELPQRGTKRTEPGGVTTYDDFPIISPPKARLADPATPLSEGKDFSSTPRGASENVDEWVPVPTAKPPISIVSANALDPDPVHPESPDTPTVVPIRSLTDAPFESSPVLEDDDAPAGNVSWPGRTTQAEYDDVVLEEDVMLVEDVPMPRFASYGDPSPATATIVPSRQVQPEAAKRRTAQVKHRKFSQLFTLLSHS